MLQQASTYNMQEVQWCGKLQIPVELVENATLHTKHFGHWTAALTAANQRQRVRHHLHRTMNECITPSHQLCANTHLNDTPVNVCHTKKLELKTFTKHKPHAGCWNHPRKQRNGLVCCSMTLFADSAFHSITAWGWRECTKHFCLWWPQLLILPFKLVRARDQTRLPSEFGANPFSGSRDIWFTHKMKKNKKSQTALKTEPYAVYCIW